MNLLNVKVNLLRSKPYLIYLVKKKYGLKNKLNAFSVVVNFTISKKTPNIKIDDGIINQLRNYLVELVVYGDNVCEKCSLFEKINNDFTSKIHTSRVSEK